MGEGILKILPFIEVFIASAESNTVSEIMFRSFALGSSVFSLLPLQENMKGTAKKGNMYFETNFIALNLFQNYKNYSIIENKNVPITYLFLD
jgi:hypothetical protein